MKGGLRGELKHVYVTLFQSLFMLKVSQSNHMAIRDMSIAI